MLRYLPKQAQFDADIEPITVYLILPNYRYISIIPHNTSMIAGKLAEDYQQTRKTTDDDQVRPKEKPPDGGKRCLVCRKTGNLARECPNKALKQSVRRSSTEEPHSSTSREETRQTTLRCYTCDGKVTHRKQCPSKALFCRNRNELRSTVKDTVLHQGVVNGFLVDDILLDTGCSKTIVRRDLVGEERWLEGESTVIQCAHGDAIAYPLGTIELEIQGKPVLVGAAVSDTLPQSALVGTDVLGLLEMLQGSSTEEPLEKALVMMMRSRTQRQPTEETTVTEPAQETTKPTEDALEPGVVNDSGTNMLTEYNFNDEFFSQGRINKPRSRKRQACQEHVEEWRRQRVGLNIPVISSVSYKRG